MILKYFLSIFVFVISVTQIFGNTYSVTAENEIKLYLDDANLRIYKAFEDLEDYQFRNNDAHAHETFQRKVRAYKVVADVIKYLKLFPYEEFHDELLKRQIRVLIKSVGIYALDETELQNLDSSLKSLRHMATDADLCEYNKPDSCHKKYLPFVRHIYSESHDPNELKHYWIEWRKHNSFHAGKHFNVFVEAFLNASRINNQHPLELWYNDYEDPYIYQNLERVMVQLKDFYKEFHAYVRNILHRKYGEFVVSANGPLPQHLIDQILVQAWKKNSLIENPFPNKKLPNLQHELEEHNVEATSILKVADEFYKSLGLSPLPEIFWAEHTKVKPREEHLGDCKSTVYDFIPDGALEYCPKSNYRKFLQSHRDFAQLHYVNEERSLPYAFYDSYNFEYAVGEAAILAASSPKHMKRLGLLPEFDYDDERNFNRVFRLAIHTMFNLPIHFVQSKLLADIFAGNIDYKAPNKHYWKLMEEWAGIEPPVDRKSTDYDFSIKFYENLEENHQTRKFTSEILGYQFYRMLCYISNDYNPRNNSKPLQKCDFCSSLEVGNVLKSMMSLGSSKSWRDVLSVLLGSDADLNGEALLEYFEPVHRWLKQQNDANGVYRGWVRSNKRIDN